MKNGVIALVLLCASFSAAGMDERLGISCWASWSPGQISRADNPHLRSVPLIPRWNDLEPTNNSFMFDSVIGSKITAAANDDLYVTIKIYVRPGTPEWLYDEMGVPRVYTDRVTDPLGNPTPTEETLHPYYFDPTYKSQFFEMIAAFGAYLNNLPQALRERILFVQSAEGSTGDGGPYKGNPTNSTYNISTTDWGAFRRETWQHYKQALPPGIPLLVNSDANTAVENSWMLANLDVIALKNGMFTHGWNISDGIQRLADFRALEAQAKALGKPVLTRGEEDAEITTYAWGTRNTPLALYWAGLYATHHQIDQWNVPKDLLKNTNNFEICAFFNRYAGLHDPATSPRAFCALVEGLNAADAVRFPANPYGTVTKGNQQRYTSIANAYAARGARMEDPAAATGGGMLNRQRDGYNDVGWNILPGNYSRFLTQINPGSGDVSWWHVDVMKKGSSYASASKYSRFARGFENASGKNAMYFNLDDNLAGGMTNLAGVKLKVIYFDDIAASTWALRYDRGSGIMAAALAVTNSGTKTWKTVETTVHDGAFANGGPNGADLALINTDSLDDIFHLIEVEALLPSLSFSTNRLIKAGGMVGQPYNASVANDVTNINGNPIQFSLLPGGPSWLSVSTNGVLSGTPGAGNVGLNQWTVRVMDDSGGSATADLLMIVDEASSQPIFTSDPLVKPDAQAWATYSGSLAGNTTNPEPGSLTFSKVSGPAWLSVASSGTLSGTPNTGDVGENLWCVEVAGGSGNADHALLMISVSPGIGPPADTLLFMADFSASTLNTNAFNNATPIPITIGGLNNLNEGTSAGSWTAQAIEESSVYANSSGNPVLFAGTGAYNLEANLSDTAPLSGGVEVSLKFAICRTGNTSTRRNYVTGLDANGQRAFRLLLSGHTADDGARTLYVENSSASLSLLAANIARSAGVTFLNADMDALDLELDSSGITVWLNDTVLTNGVPLYVPGAQNLAKLVFEGDSTWYDDIQVVLRGTAPSAYAQWAAAYGLTLGPTGDDDNDRALNFYEYATGGNPTNALDRGFVPTARVQIEGGTNWLEYIYVRRSASTSGMVCHPELSDNLVLNVWTNAGYTVVGSGPFTNGFEAVTNRILTEIKTHQFIRLHVEGLP